MKTTSAKIGPRHNQSSLVALALETLIIARSPMDDPTGPR
jgi:hypothetical protein